MHEGQVRKSGEPYFVHPIAVSHMLADLSADGDTIIAALLHDTVEDTPLTLEEIDKQFDGEVATLIDGVTKLSSKDIGTSAILNEQIESLRKIFTLMQQDVRIMVIKLYDRLHNMQTVEFLSQQRRTGLAQETFDVFVKIADRLCMQDVRDDLEGLCYNILFPTMYGQLVDLRLENEWQGQQVARVMRESIQAHTPRMVPEPSVRFEHKSWEQLLVATNEGGIKADPVSDVTMVFVTDTIENCYAVLGTLHQLWQRQMESFQDFVNAPSVNGYRGVHTTVILPDGTRVRCKIRTHEMHEYARQGVTTICFTRRDEVPHILKWTQRISPLSSDTQGSSDDFWENLKSDILGESITVHGASDHVVQIPRGSTALDGAFYLFGDDALRIASVSLNGETVPLNAPLKNADVLTVEFKNSVTVQSTWLKSAHTGMATAAIRIAVSSKSERERLETGKEMLQAVLNDRAKGFVEELSDNTLAISPLAEPYPTLNSLYLGIAEGRIDPAHAYSMLFEKKEEEERPRRFVVHYDVPGQSHAILDRLHTSMLKYDRHIMERSIRRQPNHSMVSAKVTMTFDELSEFKDELVLAGADNIEVVAAAERDLWLLSLVILLWSLNPVIAKWFLVHGVAPLTMITLRFLTFAVYSTVFFILWRWRNPAKLTPIPKLFRLSLMPTLSLCGMSIYFYALSLVPPSLHLLVLRFNTVLYPSITAKESTKRLKHLLQFAILLGSVVTFMAWFLGQHVVAGMLLSAITLCFYLLYSLTTEHTLQQNKIGMRLPYLLLVIGIFSGIIGLILVPFVPLTALLNRYTLPIVVYVLVCICISQTLYSALLKSSKFKHFTDFLLLEVPVAVVLEIGLLHINMHPIVYAGIGLTLLTLLRLRWHAAKLPIQRAG